MITFQLQRNGPYGACICGHIISLHTVAAGHGLLQLAIFVSEADGKSVEFELAYIFNSRWRKQFARAETQSLLHTPVEFHKVSSAVAVAERQHGIFVFDGSETFCDGAAHTLTRRGG